MNEKYFYTLFLSSILFSTFGNAQNIINSKYFQEALNDPLLKEHILKDSSLYCSESVYFSVINQSRVKNLLFNDKQVSCLNMDSLNPCFGKISIATSVEGKWMIILIRTQNFKQQTHTGKCLFSTYSIYKRYYKLKKNDWVYKRNSLKSITSSAYLL